VQTLDRTYLQEKIGALSQRMLWQVWQGVRLVLEVNDV